MTLPLAVLVLLLVVQAGLLGMDLVTVQSLAREAARAAAVDEDDAAVREVLGEAAGTRQVRVTFDPGGDARVAGEPVTATVEMRTRAFASFGVDAWLPARATMRVEGP